MSHQVCTCTSFYWVFTYCSPAFWPQSRSEGSAGSAAPLEEEAEEPQTLEQQHPEKQTERRKRQREGEQREVVDGQRGNDKGDEPGDGTEVMKSRRRDRKKKREEGNKKPVSERKQCWKQRRETHLHISNQCSFVLPSPSWGQRGAHLILV